jgi:hypothetical protein
MDEEEAVAAKLCILRSPACIPLSGYVYLSVASQYATAICSGPSHCFMPLLWISEGGRAAVRLVVCAVWSLDALWCDPL